MRGVLAWLTPVNYKDWRKSSRFLEEEPYYMKKAIIQRSPTAHPASTSSLCKYVHAAERDVARAQEDLLASSRVWKF